MAGVFFSNNVALSTRGGIYDAYPDKNNPYYGPPYITKNVFNNRTGIFTENPLSAFHVTGGSYLDGHLTVTGNLSVWGDQTRFDTYVYITSSTEIVVQNNSNTTPALFVSNAGDNMIFQAFDADTVTPALVVDGKTSAPGYVGIGVLSPKVRLDIYNNNGSTGLIPPSPAAGTVIHSTQIDNAINRILLDSFGTSSRSSFTGRYARNGVDSPAAVQANDVLAEITGRGHNGSTYPDNSNGRLKVIAAENWSDTNNGTYISFDTTKNTTTTPREVARFADTGFLGLNVTNPNQQLTVSGSISAKGTLSASYIEITPFIGTYTYLPNTRAAFVSNVNSYSQVNHQNLFNGTAASSDFIATTDTGTDTTGYIDLGINNSSYNQYDVFDIVGSGGGYLYTQGGDLAVGTGAANKNLVFFTGATLSANERMRIDSSGNINIGNSITGVGAATLKVKGQTDINITGAANTNIGTSTTATTVTIGNANGPTTIAINGSTTLLGATNINNSGALATSIATGTGNLSLGNGTGSNTVLGNPVNINVSNSTDNTNISTGSTTGTVSIGNNTSGATTTILGATTTINGTSVSIGSANTTTLNIGTKSDLSITEGNSTGDHTLNSDNITAPNQVVNADASVLTRSAGDTRYKSLAGIVASDFIQNNTATLADLTGASVALKANTTYRIYGIIKTINGNATTNGHQIQLNSDNTSGANNHAFANIIVVGFSPNPGSSGNRRMTENLSGNLLTTANQTTQATAGAFVITIIEGFIKPVVDCNLKVRIAPNAAALVDTTTKAGSMITALPVSLP